MALSLLERETIICFNEAEKIASIEVPVNTRLHKRLLDKGEKPLEQRRLDGEVVTEVFEVPAAWVKINPPRELTPEKRQALQARMADMRSRVGNVSCEDD